MFKFFKYSGDGVINCLWYTKCKERFVLDIDLLVIKINCVSYTLLEGVLYIHRLRPHVWMYGLLDYRSY